MTNDTQTTARRQAAARDIVAHHLNDRAARIISGRVNASGVNTWQVKGHGDTYTVTLTPVVTCSCPDHLKRGLPCKHILAVMELAGEQPQPVATAPAAPVAPARPRRPRTEPREELDW